MHIIVAHGWIGPTGRVVKGIGTIFKVRGGMPSVIHVGKERRKLISHDWTDSSRS